MNTTSISQDRVRELINVNKNAFIQLSHYIYEHPELGDHEVEAAGYIENLMKNQGFTVTHPLINHPTALVAEYGHGKKPVIAFAAEYDALPGYGPYDEPAHACGHNWIAATMCGCGITLSKLADELSCCVRVIGCPAEETVGLKYNLCKSGVFDDVDIVLQAHLDENNCMDTVLLALNSIEFHFKGRSAHASQYPEQGINALDSVILTYNGINALRQHLRDDARVHGIIIDGGKAANIVPDHAACRFSFRAADKSYLKEMRKKIINIAEGASLMTGSTLEYHDYENPFDDMINIPSLMAATGKAFKKTGIDTFLTHKDYLAPGSSDIGNVSYVCPTLYVELDAEADEPLHVHDESALRIVDSPAAHEKMLQTIEAFVLTSIDICQDENLLEKIKSEFLKLSNTKQTNIIKQEKIKAI